MKTRRTTITAGAAAAVIAASLVPCAPAHAAAGGTTAYFAVHAKTKTNSKGGYGEAIALISAGSNKLGDMIVCDAGNPDGRRTVAYLMIGNLMPWTAVDANGPEAPCGTIPNYDGEWISPGSTIKVLVCLRDGPRGPDTHCGDAIRVYQP